MFRRSLRRQKTAYWSAVCIMAAAFIVGVPSLRAAKPPAPAAPVIASLSTSHASPGEFVQVNGSNFGIRRTGDVVLFGGVPATVYASWSNDAVVVQVPVGAVRGQVIVEVDKVRSNGVNFTPWNPPVLTAIAPAQAPVGSTITLTGTGFGSSQPDSVVNIVGRQATVTSWTDTTITAVVPDVASGPVSVDRGGQVSASLPFTRLYSPVIAAVNPAAALIGTPVMVVGSNFGDAQSAGTITFNGTPAAVVSWSDTAVVVLAPSDGPVVLTQNALSSVPADFIALNPPELAALVPEAGPVGAIIRIAGSSFGDVQGAGEVMFGSTPASVVNWTDSAIDVVVPDVPTCGVSVSQNGTSTAPLQFTRFYQPVIDSLSASEGLIGSPVAISGSHFGDVRGAGSVTFGGVNAVVTSWSDTQVIALVPGDGPVVVTQDGLSSEASPFDGYNAPVLLGLSANRGLVGGPLVLTGTDFGDAQVAGSVTVGGVAAAVTSWSDTSIEIVVPDAGTGNVVVTQHGLESAALAFEPYRLPAIDAIAPTKAQVDSIVTVTGRNFGATQGAATIGGTPVTVSEWSDTSIRIVVPQGAVSGDVVIVNSDGSSNALPLEVFSAPVVTALSPVISGDPLSDGEHFTLTGTGFEPEQGVGWVTWAGIPCSVVSWSETRIEAVVPDGAPAGFIGVWQNDICSNGIWQQFNPVIDGISNWVAVVGEEITITGSDFGAVQPGSAYVAVDGVSASIVSWSDTQITFRMPAVTRVSFVGVYRDGVGSNGKQLIPAPRLTSLSAVTAVPGEQLTIYGEAFGPSQGADDVVKIGGVAVPVVSWSDSAVTVMVTEQAKCGYVGVYRSYASSNGLWFLPAYQPVIASVSATSAAVGEDVTISGTGFYDQSAGSRVTLNGLECPIVAWSPTSVTVTVPAGASGGLLGVWNYGLCSNGVELTVTQ